MRHREFSAWPRRAAYNDVISVPGRTVVLLTRPDSRWHAWERDAVVSDWYHRGYGDDIAAE